MLYRLRLLVSLLLLQLAQCQESAIRQVLLVDRHLRRGSLRVGRLRAEALSLLQRQGGSEYSPRNFRGGESCTGLDGQAVQALQSVARGGTVLLA